MPGIENKFKCINNFDHQICVCLSLASCNFWHFTSKSVVFVYCFMKQSDCRQFGRPSHWKGLSRSLRGGSLYIGRRWRSYAGWTQRGTKDVGLLFFPTLSAVEMLSRLNVYMQKCWPLCFDSKCSIFCLPLVFVWKVSLQLRMWELWLKKWWRSVSSSPPHVCLRWSNFYTTCKTGNCQWSVGVCFDIYSTYVNISNFMRFVDVVVCLCVVYWYMIMHLYFCSQWNGRKKEHSNPGSWHRLMEWR